MELFESFVLTVAYVGSLYILPKWIRSLDRDDPKHILARFLMVSLVSFIGGFYIYFKSLFKDDRNILKDLGFRSNGLFNAIVYPLILMLFLFLGRISIYLYKLIYFPQIKKNRESFIVRFRTYFMGPLTEEFIFRSCMVSCLEYGGYSSKQVIFTIPFTFGIAHLHHIFQHIKNGRTIIEAIQIVLFQLLYTTIFGIFASFLFIRTKHFISVFFVHIFCNYMSVPDLSYLQKGHYLNHLSTRFNGIYLMGILLFIVFLNKFTNPQLYQNE